MEKSYIPLYRKYRPQKLEQVVGQEHIKKALTNAIESKRISHAYLFTGPRGTGKTSTARIFAKSLNCEKGPTISPCNECENCQNITRSIPIDVVEIDAASNRSVDDAEEIIQNVAMAPVHSRYKIYIIDEVHMLTPTAFNALLKTLEEPPANVIFILATTEVHKVLDTIKSRCQRFDFKRITTLDITKHLRYISDSEKINITEEALTYIASNSAGGMRDSIALLDQLSVLNSEKDAITVDDINRLLGRLSFTSLISLFEAIIKSDRNSALNILNDIYNQGNEPTQILSNFLEHLRNSLILKSIDIKSAPSVIQLNEEQIKKLNSCVTNIETHQLVSLINKCAEYIKELKRTSNPKLWLDIAFLDMANLAENTKLEKLQERLSALETGSQTRVISPYNTPPMPVNKMEVKEPALIQTLKQSPKQPQEKPKTTDVQENNETTVQLQSTSNNIKETWAKFLENVSSTPSRIILKQQALPVKLTAEEIIISIKNPNWLKSFGHEGDRFAFIQEASNALFNTEPKIIVREPKAGDNKLREETQPTTDNTNKNTKKTLIPPKPENMEQVEQALNQINTPNQSEKLESAEKKTENITNQTNNTYSKNTDSGFHSDNVNIIMDLFEGKIIE